MKIWEYNRTAWDQKVEKGEDFTLPASPEEVEAARHGEVDFRLTPSRPVPPGWFPALPGLDVLCLGAGGGQHGPLLAAAGANVAVLDISPRQLAQDRMVARRDRLQLSTIQGDMSDLSMFAAESFDLVANPVSNLYIPDLAPFWSGIHRILRPGGLLLAGFMNPVFYIFDREEMDDQGTLVVRHSLPYSDLTSLDEPARRRLVQEGWPLEFGHTLETQIGGQIRAGFRIEGFYEDRDARCVLDDYLPVYIATRAVKVAA